MIGISPLLCTLESCHGNYSLLFFSFCQAQAAVAIGLEKLQELDIPTLRPLDYFAEMVKTDDHMRKV